MNPSNQDISVSGLLGSSGKAAGNAALSAGSGAQDASNSLNKEKFSAVLGKEQQRLNSSAESAPSGEAAASPSVVNESVAVNEAAIEVFVPPVEGKVLPLEGGELPVEDAVVTVGGVDQELLESSTITPETVLAGAFGETASGVEGDALSADAAENPGAVLRTGDDPESSEKSDGSDNLSVISAAIPAASILPNLIAQQGAAEDPAELVGQLRQAGLTPAVPVSAWRLATGSSPDSEQGSLARTAGGGDSATADGQPRPVGADLLLNRVQQALPAATLQVRDTLAGTESKTSGSTEQALSNLSGIAAGLGIASDKGQPLSQSVPTYSVPVEVGKPGWSDQVIQRVMWMSAQNVSKAEIALDPPELGPLQVRVQTQGEHMTVVFSSAHGTVRDALDQGMHRLRDLFDSQGLDLVDVDIADDRPHRDSSGSEEDAQPELSYGQSLSADERGEDLVLREGQSGGAAGNLRVPGLVDHYV